METCTPVATCTIYFTLPVVEITIAECLIAGSPDIGVAVCFIALFEVACIDAPGPCKYCPVRMNGCIEIIAEKAARIVRSPFSAVIFQHLVKTFFDACAAYIIRIRKVCGEILRDPAAGCKDLCSWSYIIVNTGI